MTAAQRTPDDLPFFPLNEHGEPMGCVCDYGGAEMADWCEKCPHRAVHREAASAEVAARRAAIAKAEGSAS